jgi:AraC-like DNA-binding protein
MARDWARYWRSAEQPLEAMRAHFESHTYHRHSHDTYSFGLTEQGAQTFTCRGGRHTSVGGMVMTFNPEDPHDGHAVDPLGFTYRMVHIGPELVAEVLAGVAERPVPLPLFTEPVSARPELTRRLAALSAALLDERDPGPLRRDELLTQAVRAMAGHAGVAAAPASLTGADSTQIAARARAALAGAGPTAEVDLAELTGRSRFTVYRAFVGAYGLSPSDYQRQLRLRRARDLLRQGRPAAEVAALTGFADQSHLTRWFGRHFGITPGAYQRAAAHG